MLSPLPTAQELKAELRNSYDLQTSALQEKNVDLYLATLSRRPKSAEVAVVLNHVRAVKNDPGKALRDLQFALMNSSEFLLRH